MARTAATTSACVLSFFVACLLAHDAFSEQCESATALQGPTPKAGGYIAKDHIMLQSYRLGSNAVKAELLKNSHTVKAELLKDSVSGSSLLETEIKPIVRSPISDEEEDDETDSAGDLVEEGYAGQEDEEEHEEEHGEEDEEDHRTEEADADRLQRVARFADANNDSHVSIEEMKAFAYQLRERQRQQQTNESLTALDVDSSGDITMLELRNDLPDGLAQHQKARYNAADKNQDGSLQWEEFHFFVHPELDQAVLHVETEYQLAGFDQNKDGVVDFEEFKAEGISHDEEEFDEAAALEDFTVHDSDRDKLLNFKEFGLMLRGHEMLHDNINKAFDAADINADGHLHVEDEVPHQVTQLLGSEFIEDYFYHDFMDARHHRHDEF